MQITSIIFDVITFIMFLALCYKYTRLRDQKDSEYYTDYAHKNLVLRVYKPEFEYEAIGKIPIEKILDRGVLSIYYNWCLIEL